MARAAAMSPAESVAETVRRARSSFYWGMRLLPRERRLAIFAIYAYCRVLDDIADEPGSDESKRAGLDAWRLRLDDLHAEADPVARALAEAARRFDLPHAELHAIIDGMDMDVGGGMVAPPTESLLLYCRRVAGAVGLLSLPIFGARGASAERFALALGEALQLTNILRDVAEDARLGRLYLPAEVLARTGLAGLPPAAVAAHPRLPLARADLGTQAADAFRRAEAALAETDRKPLRPALVMMETYRRVLETMRRQGWAPVGRPRIGTAARLGIMLRYGLLGLR